MSYEILTGNVLDTIKSIPDGSVRTAVTSPPYYGLRDYGTASWIDGDPNCDHNPQKADGGKRADRALPLGRGGLYKEVCGKCGAGRVDEQIGLEESPEAYIQSLIDVFREVRRVLADDGTLWVNIGDSYATHASASKKHAHNFRSAEIATENGIGALKKPTARAMGLKEKDLIGIPWMLAFALRDDGWYLRSEVIWHKPNPMPESVTDRPTKAHEQIFLFSKSPKYYYDQEAILEPASINTERRISQNVEKQVGSTRGYGGMKANGNMKAVTRKHKDQKLSKGSHGFDMDSGEWLGATLQDGTLARNKRSVWTVTTKPYKEAHFATFPPDLIEPCILAGSAAGDTVLDPFNGSGTTGEVALIHRRKYIGCELNPEYVKLTHKRLKNINPVLFGMEKINT